MLKVLSLFSGIGAFEKALTNLKVPFELVNFCEIDKYASDSYCAIYKVSKSKNLGDITKVNITSIPDFDLMTYGFPCQDISLAGKQKGLFNEDGTQTRSGLFFNALKIIEQKKPKIAIAENVKNLTSKKFSNQFKIVLNSLEDAGYNNYWGIMNSKDYGIPQNRERVFIVSIRKDIDTGLFLFPVPIKLKTRLKDYLDKNVDEKYYLSEENKPSIKSKLGDFITIPLKRGYSVDVKSEKDFTNDIDAIGNYSKSDYKATMIVGKNGLTPTIRENHGQVVGIIVGDNGFERVRKLTPKECFRLQGFSDEDYFAAESVNSNSQLYKQAGNSITVNTLEYLFSQLFNTIKID